MNTVLTYLRTLRYLKPMQVYGRIWFRLVRPVPDLRAAPPLRQPRAPWTPPLAYAPSIVGSDRFIFLNEEHGLGGGWDDPTLSKLWRYHLHYFDGLNAAPPGMRADAQRMLVTRWIRENPPGYGTGWEPYPTSLRIVNWIKWQLGGESLPDECLHNLAVQVRWLARRLEYHIQGNHLFANAKALIFAGLFFDGAEADRFLRAGVEIARRELNVQILTDGGHFERSPMYHAQILEDLLDLLNVIHTYQFSSLADELVAAARPMQDWLAALTHPDGEIGFFNDAAIGQAARAAELESYAQRLGLPSVDRTTRALTHLRESGYIRCELPDAVVLLDVAPIGPDHLPAHAHADTLSFELSIFGHRVIVNSGTSRYGNDAERQRQRGTAAHSTVTVAGQDSSEVWGGFRVARRARPFDLRVSEEPRLVVQCAHDGYLRPPMKVIHTRTWSFGEGSVTIEDRLNRAHPAAEARFYLHPDVRLEVASDHAVSLRIIDGAVGISCEGGAIEVVPSTWHPRFGLVVPNRCVVIRFRNPTLRTTVSWTRAA